MGAGSIRVSAMVMLRDETRARQLVTRFPPDPSVPVEFHRLVGGGVEFGERARDAAVREVAEETGLRLGPDDLEHLGVVENLFEYAGEPGHEVVFVYSAAVPSGFVPDEGAWSVEADGSAMYLEWRSTDAPLDAPLYPALPRYQETGSAFPSS